MRINEVLEKYDNSETKGSIAIAEFSDGERDYMAIEATPEGLRFIAELLLAHADDTESLCDWSMSPKGGGFVWFDERSRKGLFIHRLPCEHGFLTSEKTDEREV